MSSTLLKKKKKKQKTNYDQALIHGLYIGRWWISVVRPGGIFSIHERIFSGSLFGVWISELRVQTHELHM